MDFLENTKSKASTDGRIPSERLPPERILGQDPSDDFGPFNAGEPIVEALGADGEAFVVQAELMENGGVDVVDVGWGFDRAEPKFISLTIDLPSLKAAPGEPHGEGVDVVIATGGLAHFPHRGCGRTPRPRRRWCIEQTSLLEVAHERGAGVVDVLTLEWQMLFQILRGGNGVGVLKATV